MLKKHSSKMLCVAAIVLFWTLSISVPSYAKGGGSGMSGGHGNGGGTLSGKAKTQGIAEGAVPPGLAKKGKVPSGLEKQGKTPAGWSKGKKKGWKKKINKRTNGEALSGATPVSGNKQ